MTFLFNSKTNFFLIAGALCLSFLFLVPVATAMTWNIDYTTVRVNDTVYWDGHSFDYLNLTYYNRSEIDTIVVDYVPYTGATGDVDIGAHNIFVGGIASRFNSTLLIDGTIGDSDATLVIESDVNKYSCINLTEGGHLGFSICNDGAGSNRFVIANLQDDYEYVWIDRDDGLIYLNNDTIITGDLNVSGDIVATNFVGDGSALTNLPGDPDNDFHIFFNGSVYINVTYNLTAGDINDIGVSVQPGKKFIFGKTFE